MVRSAMSHQELVSKIHGVWRVVVIYD